MNLTDDLLFINEDDKALNDAVRVAIRDAGAEMERLSGASFHSYEEVATTSWKLSGALKKFLVLHSSAEVASYDRRWLQKTWEVIRDTSGQGRGPFTDNLRSPRKTGPR